MSSPYNKQWKFILMKYNLKRKEIMNCLNLSNKEYLFKINTCTWTKEERDHLRVLGIDDVYLKVTK